MARGDTAISAFIAAPSSSHRAYLFHGGPDAPIDSGPRALIAAIRAENASPVSLTYEQAPPSAQQLDQLATFVQSPSLFGDAQILWLDDIRETHRAAVMRSLDGIEVATDKTVLLSTTQLRAKSALLGALREHPHCLVVACRQTDWTPTDIRAAFDARSDDTLSDAAITRLCDLALSLSVSAFADMLDRLALYGADGDSITEHAVDACAPSALTGSDDDLTALLILGRRRDLLASFARRRDLGENPSSLLASIGRGLTGVLLHSRGSAGGRSTPPLFWKLDQARKTAARKFTDFDRRLERALVELHRSEATLRSSSQVDELEIDRLALRLTHLFI